MPNTRVFHAQPVDLVHAMIPAEHQQTQRIPKVRAHIERHRIGEPGKVPVRYLIPGLLPERGGIFARLVGAR